MIVSGTPGCLTLFPAANFLDPSRATFDSIVGPTLL